MISQTQTQTASIQGYLIRVVDICVGLLLSLGAAPVLILKFLYRKCRYGIAIETVYIHGSAGNKAGLYQFTGDGICRQWPHLVNLLNGQLSLVGSAKQFYFEGPHTKETSTPLLSDNKTPIKPGLLSFELMHQSAGINFEDQQGSLQRAHSNIASYLLAAVRITIAAMLSNTTADRSVAEISLFNLDICNITMDKMLKDIMDQSIAHSSCSAPLLQLSHIQQSHNQQASHQQTGQTYSSGMTQYAFVNADCLNMTVKDPIYYHCLKHSCDRIFADGLGIRIASHWKGVSPKDNLNGTDMFPRLCDQASQASLSIFLLGGAPGIAEQAALNMQESYPGLTIAGTHHGYLDSQQLEKAVIDKINASDASILLVAMGAPKQELWLEKYQPQLNVAVGIGVGGLFDFYSEKITRAPLWVRQIGMEWICRLLAEPKRMWKRYILGNPLFIFRVLIEIMQEKRGSHLEQAHNEDLAATNTDQQTMTQMVHLDNCSTKNNQAIKRCDRNRAMKRLNLSLKRSLDVLGASSLLIILLPLFISVALLIRIESKGAVLFSQQRAGKNNTPFTMWKFRSMYLDAETRLSQLQSANEMKGGVTFKMKKDPRITSIGKIIRKLSIDELPQLWNVICGDMSLVGPRPALLSEVKHYSVQDRRRLTVKPGITCIWQVSGRSNIPFDKQVELDVDYIYQQSFFTDIWLLIKTIPAVILARGAY